MNSPRMHMLMCFGTSCLSSGAAEVRKAIEKELADRGLSGEVSIVGTGCNGFCAAGPIMVIYPGGVFYQKLAPGDAAEIVEEHVLKGRPVERLMFRSPVDDRVIPRYSDIPFFARQNLRVLRNKGRISAESISEYIGRDGYAALARALSGMTPEEIIAEVKQSGLRGRGGGGFPTGLKWELCRKAGGGKKYILCNADEGDPGAFMDRSILESDPHAVLEGMMIGARAIGADEGYIYCRAEYPLALERLETAIGQCRELGLLGDDVLGSGFRFDLHICRGSGAFVCGEETALMRSVEGLRGEPRPRPPFPAHRGLWDRPSVLNNVETFASVPLIVHNGADWFRSVGTERSPGTKIFALTGDVRNVGLVEVDMGIPLGEIVYDIGGGIPGGKQFKAAQIGGPSGGCIPRGHLNVPVDYESLIELGAIMGSGGLIVMDDDTCMVDMARFFLEFVQDESCGKCTPCRVGTKRMLETLERICRGEGREGDVERLIELGMQIKDTALCGLGQTAPNPVLSTIRHFRDEYDAHIRDRRCPAGVCPELVRAPCQNACPAGVDVPGFVSLVGEKRYAEALRLHRERNPFAVVCARVCFHPCEGKCRRSTIDDSVAIRGVKRFMVDQETAIQLPDVRADQANARRRVAVVGAGPAGLSCAYFLARLGYRPDVLEATDVAGGMLAQTIPAYRLPRSELERELFMIKHMGVNVITGRRLGRDFTLRQLREDGYEAVFLAVGAPHGQKLGVPGEETAGVTDALEFLRRHNLGGGTGVGRRVVVIGGGNSALDAARIAVRLGAESVTVAYRRTREEMPAYEEEVTAAEREGVKFDFLMAPVGIVARGGRAAGVRLRPQKLGEFDSGGRRRPVDAGEPDVELECETVVVAIGQKLEVADLLDGQDVELNRRGYVRADRASGQTSVEWLFAGGDAVTGPASVVEAVAAGERAAVGIDRYLTGEEHAFWRQDRRVDTFFDPEADPVEYPRAPAEELEPERRRKGLTESSWRHSVAERETKRCLRCDYRRESEQAEGVKHA